MYIKKIIIKNCYCFDNFEIDLDKNTNIIVGTNGVGKTKFLSIVYDALLYFSDNKCLNNLNYFKNNSNAFIDIHLSMSECFECINNFIFFKKVISMMDTNDIIDDINKLKKNYKCNICNDNCIRIQMTNGLSKCFLGNIDLGNLYTETKNVDNICLVKSIDYSQKEILWNDIIKNYIDEINSFFNYHDKHALHQIPHDNISYFNPIRNMSEYVAYELIRQEIKKNIIGIGLNNHINIIERYNTLHNIFKDDINTIINDIKYNDNTYQVRESLMDNDMDLMVKNKYLFLKKNDKHQKIQDLFFNIMGKTFDMKINDCRQYENNLILPYIDIYKILPSINNIIKKINKEYKQQQQFTFNADFVITRDNQKYDCSKGEYELIKFLVLYYTDDKSIIFIDEPCKHLSAQNKERFRKIFLENENINKQIIVITHDIELISEKTCDNIIRFSVDKKNNIKLSKLCNLNKNAEKNNNKKKLLVRSRGVLFSDLCLLVEGDHDMKFIGIFLEYCEKINPNFPKYYMVDLRGSGTKIWEILDKLDIKYKCIYDYDKIAIKFNKKIKYNALDFDKIKNFPHIDKIIDSESYIKNFYDTMNNKYDLNYFASEKISSGDTIFDKNNFTFEYIKNQIIKYEDINKEKLKDKSFSQKHVENINRDMNLIYDKIKINISEIIKILKNYDFFIWSYNIYDIEGIWNELNKISSDKKGVGSLDEISNIIDDNIDTDKKEFSNILLQDLHIFLSKI